MRLCMNGLPLLCVVTQTFSVAPSFGNLIQEIHRGKLDMGFQQR